MWGNTKGWVIAIILGLLIAVGFWQLVSANQVTLPTASGTNPDLLKPYAFAASPQLVVPMITAGDAGDLYRQAIEDVRKNRIDYDNALNEPTLRRLQKLAAIKQLTDAAPLTEMKLLTLSPQDNIGYFRDNISPDLADLSKAGLCLEQAGLQSFSAKKYDDAKKYFSAEFSLGYKLFSERVTFKEAEKGISFMRPSIQMLAQIATLQKDEARYNELKTFDANIGMIFEQMQGMWKLIYSVDEKVVAAHVGDIFYYSSDKMKERMWRVEAILKIGRFKYNVGGDNARLVDERAAQVQLKQLEVTETDPLLKAAIQAAKNLTLEQFRAIQ